MRSFDDILAISAERKGGFGAVLDGMDPPKSAAELAAIPDDRWLSGMTRCVFQAGFNWKVVDAMWPGFEAAFKGFEVGKCAMMDDAWFDALVADTRIVRYGAKIRSVQSNAIFIQEKAAEHGSFGAMVGNWPAEDFIGLLNILKTEGTRLGGTTGQYFLRMMGKDSFILSRDVIGRLIAEGVIDKPPTSKAAMAKVQDAFNAWAAQSNRPLKEISRTLAQSIG